MDEESWAEISDAVVRKQITILIQSFRDAGFNVNYLENYHTWMLIYAAIYGNKDIIDFLVQNGKPGNIMNHDCLKELHIATRNGHEDIIRIFPTRKIVIEEPWTNTVLHHACAARHLDLVKFLLSKECDINSKNVWGHTSLHLTALCSYSEIVQYLVESGADVHCLTIDGWNALHLACIAGDSLDIVKYLIKKGCNENAKDRISQKTPLHYAVQYATMEIVEHLLYAGADFNLKNDYGLTPFNVIIQKPLCLEGIAVFLEYGAYFQSDHYNFIIDQPLHKKCILQDVKLCTQSVINKFNCADLPKVYNIPEVAQCLPDLEKMKIGSHCNRAKVIAESVKYEIVTKGYCNVLNVCPNTLYCICARYLVQLNDS